MQLDLFAVPTHRVVSKVDTGHGLIRVECACGHWQQVRWMAFFETVWLKEHQI